MFKSRLHPLQALKTLSAWSVEGRSDIDLPARVRPDVRVRVQGDCRRERAPRCGARQRRRHQALERESPQGAQPTGIPAGAEGTCILARNGRGRCGERPHARNGRSRATRRAERGERGGPYRTHLSSRPRHSAIQLPSWWTQKGRGRLGHRESRLSRANGRRAARERPRAFIVLLTQQPQLSQSYSLRDSEVI